MRATRVGLAVIVASLSLGATAAPASAVNQLTCVGTQSLTFSPGVTNTPKTTTINTSDVLAPCLSLTDPTVTSGTSSTQVTRNNFSCITLLGGGPASRVFHWSNGRTSKFDYNATVNIVEGQLVATFTGAITEGEFAGSTALGTVTLLADLRQCDTSEGITQTGGPFTFNVLL